MAAEIHQLPHSVDCHITERLILALRDAKSSVPVGLDWGMIVCGEGREAQALVVLSRNQAVPIAFHGGILKPGISSCWRAGLIGWNFAEILRNQAVRPISSSIILRSLSPC